MSSQLNSNDNQIPIVDISKFASVAERDETINCISSALLKYGTFYITNHGINAEFLKKFSSTTKQFFDLPVEKKDEIHKRNGFRGYFRLKEEKTFVNNVSSADHKEGINYFNNFKVQEGKPEKIFCKENPWPKEEYVPEFAEVITEFLEKMLVLGGTLLKALAESLGLPDDYFVDQFTSEPFEQLTLLHYLPYQQNNDTKKVFGVNEHTDYGGLTMLLQDDVGGLEVRLPDGQWLPIKYIPDSFIVMIGDSLDIMTGGMYSATVHRVLTPDNKHRYSSALFYDPGVECFVQPAPIDYGSFSKKTSQENLPKTTTTYRYGDYVYDKFTKIYSKEK